MIWKINKKISEFKWSFRESYWSHRQQRRCDSWNNARDEDIFLFLSLWNEIVIKMLL